MYLKKITPEELPRFKKALVRFVDTYKDQHITREARDSLRQLGRSDLAKPGTIILIAREQKETIGLLAAKGYGKDFSLAVVRRRLRSKGVGRLLLQKAIEELGSFQVEIAADNVPSLKIAFACKMVGYDIFVRDSGKVVLRLKTSTATLTRNTDIDVSS